MKNKNTLELENGEIVTMKVEKGWTSFIFKNKKGKVTRRYGRNFSI